MSIAFKTALLKTFFNAFLKLNLTPNIYIYLLHVYLFPRELFNLFYCSLVRFYFFKGFKKKIKNHVIPVIRKELKR